MEFDEVSNISERRCFRYWEEGGLIDIHFWLSLAGLQFSENFWNLSAITLTHTFTQTSGHIHKLSLPLDTQTYEPIIIAF